MKIKNILTKITVISTTVIISSSVYAGKYVTNGFEDGYKAGIQYCNFDIKAGKRQSTESIKRSANTKGASYGRGYAMAYTSCISDKATAKDGKYCNLLSFEAFTQDQRANGCTKPDGSKWGKAGRKAYTEYCNTHTLQESLEAIDKRLSDLQFCN